MSNDARTSRWGHRALNLALCALGVVVMALLYALVSQHLGGASPPPASEGPSTAGASPAPASASPGETSSADEIIQVGVRNGCGVDGLAAEARGFLVRAGFDVVEVGNYSSFDLDSSIVIDRVGNPTAARRVARAMGIPEERVRQEVGAEYYLDASVVLGSDYRSLKPFRDGDPAASSTAAR